MATSAAQIKQVIDLRSSGTSFTDIAKEVGVSESLTKYIWYHNKPKGQKYLKVSSDRMHYLTADEITTVKMMHERGMKANEIKEKTGLTTYNVYRAVKMAKAQGKNGHPRGPRRETNGLDVKVYNLKQKGLSLVAIAEKLDMPKGTVSSAYYRYLKNNGHSKGEKLNGNASASDNSSTNGASQNSATTHKGWTLESIAGACSAEVTRVISGFSDTYHNAGTGITAEKIQRRVLELLASETVRP